MTETTAAIAMAQLNKHKLLAAGRIEQAESFTAMASKIPGIKTPIVKEGCTHVYYIWAIKLDHGRDWFVRALRAEGVPVRQGYATPLYLLPDFRKYRKPSHYFPVTGELHDHSLVTFENCAYDPSREQLKQIRDAFHKVGEIYSQRIVNGTMAAE